MLRSSVPGADTIVIDFVNPAPIKDALNTGWSIYVYDNLPAVGKLQYANKLVFPYQYVKVVKLKNGYYHNQDKTYTAYGKLDIGVWASNGLRFIYKYGTLETSIDPDPMSCKITISTKPIKDITSVRSGSRFVWYLEEEGRYGNLYLVIPISREEYIKHMPSILE